MNILILQTSQFTLPDPNSILVIVTIVLVLVTYYYAIQTKRTVNVMKQANTMQFRPAVKASIVSRGPMHIELQIENYGKGPATELEVNLSIKQNQVFIKNWIHSLLAPKESRKILIPISDTEVESDVNYFKHNPTTIFIDSHYCSTLGEKFEDHDEIDVTKYVNQFETIISLYEEEPLNRMARAMEKMSNNVESIHKKISDLSKNTNYDLYREDSIKLRVNFLKQDLDSSELNIEKKNSLKTLIEQIGKELIEKPYPIYMGFIKNHLEEIRKIDDSMVRKINETLPDVGRIR